MTISYLDITYVVNKLVQFISKPRTTHLHVVHHLGEVSPRQGIFFSSSSALKLRAYACADWGSYLSSRECLGVLCFPRGFLGVFKIKEINKPSLPEAQLKLNLDL